MKHKFYLLSFAFVAAIGCTSDRTDETAVETTIASVNPDETLSTSTSNPISGQYVVIFNDGVFAKNNLLSKSSKESKSSYLSKTNSLLAKIKNNDLGLGIDNSKITNAFGYALEGFVAKNLTEADVQALKNDSRVKSVQQDYLITLAKPTKPGGGGGSGSTAQETPWGITRVGGAGDGTGKTAWIIDSGIDLDHPDLNVDTARGLSFTGDNNPDDGNGHGTHVAGTIAAINNNTGVIGVAAGADVVPLKVLDSSGSGSFSWTIEALDYVYANGSAGDVVNMSLGPSSPYTDSAVDQAAINVASKGIKVAIAAGNNYDDANLYTPARAEHANIYTISAIAEGDYWAYFSNYGTPVDYAAPGYLVKSTWMGGGYNTISGTSMATPHAAGVLLLGNPTTDGYVKSAYWEYTRKGGGTLTGNYGATNSYSLSIYRYDKDGNDDPIIHR